MLLYLMGKPPGLQSSTVCGLPHGSTAAVHPQWMNRSAYLVPHEPLTRPATAVGQHGELHYFWKIFSYAFPPFPRLIWRDFLSPDAHKASPPVLPLPRPCRPSSHILAGLALFTRPSFS
ncbi:uncharacterized protein LAESUDRAFT_442003 [Laetiporus sulphureus 93-53]|uniref:Uncharacterized protein n=1 Tax=Laetiporus sulphureus 93-53 TaxID=1314785 RepID=A0A165C2Y8_9APHY|nr:uncharacterized protein LAESUDRAFT_442003 [Laetiporus sulphureus 93-53]KZT02107.1 hypothetical protein LAESUDRAFT_442003 [Laetiporus sulphureus 93-53]